MSTKNLARPVTSAKTAPVAKRTRSIVLGDPDVELLRVDLVRPDGRVLTMTLDVAAERVDLEVDRAEGEEHFRVQAWDRIEVQRGGQWHDLIAVRPGEEAEAQAVVDAGVWRSPFSGELLPVRVAR